MVSFVCDRCNDVMTKPKTKNHRCRGATFHCLDCNSAFTQQTVQAHNQCITEAEKWHGKFANQRGASSINQRVKKTNANDAKTETTAAETPAKDETASKSEKSKTEKPEKKSSKRKRSDSEADSKQKKKKSKVEEKETPAATIASTNFVINSAELKWKRNITKALKKGDNKTLTKDELKKKVVDTLLKDVKKQLENNFEEQLQQQTKYVKVDGTKVTLKK